MREGRLKRELEPFPRAHGIGPPCRLDQCQPFRYPTFILIDFHNV